MMMLRLGVPAPISKSDAAGGGEDDSGDPGHSGGPCATSGFGASSCK